MQREFNVRRPAVATRVASPDPSEDEVRQKVDYALTEARRRAERVERRWLLNTTIEALRAGARAAAPTTRPGNR